MGAKKMPERPDDREVRLRVRAREFVLPPVRDVLVIGARSPVGCVAMQRALSLLSPDTFEAIEISDHPVITDVVVRQNLLRRISRERRIGFIIERIAPLMGEVEILHLDVEVELEIEAAL